VKASNVVATGNSEVDFDNTSVGTLMQLIDASILETKSIAFTISVTSFWHHKPINYQLIAS
jgi:hypothetical protein